MNVAEIIEKLLDLKDFKCPYSLSNYCIFCNKNKECTESKFEEITDNHFLLKKTINSAFLYLKVPTSDDVERSIAKYVIREILHKFHFVMKSDLDKYDLIIVVRYPDLKMTKVKETIEKLIRWLLEEFPEDLYKIRMRIRESILHALEERLRGF